MDDDPLAFDRLSNQLFSIDVAELRQIQAPKVRPAKRRRQKIIRFRERQGSLEIFSVLQTIPYRGHETEAPPTQPQHEAVMRFFSVEPETRYQAATLLSARDYAEAASQAYRFDVDRTMLLWIAATAFILSSKDIRSRVRARNIGLLGRNSKAGIYQHAPFRKVLTFCDNVIDDLRGEGSLTFG